MIKRYKECPICKKTFLCKRAGNNKLPITCSKECRYKFIAKKESRQISLICATCGKEFHVCRTWAFDKRSKSGRIYCSRECRWSDKFSYTEKQKRDARNYVFSAIKWRGLQKGVCNICGDPFTQAHHYKGYEKKNWLNVIWLCKKHHVQEHERLRRLGLLELL